VIFYFFQDMTILVPTNDIVDSLNNYILSMIPGETKTYLSADCNTPFPKIRNLNSYTTNGALHCLHKKFFNRKIKLLNFQQLIIYTTAAEYSFHL